MAEWRQNQRRKDGSASMPEQRPDVSVLAENQVSHCSILITGAALIRP
jgi:hypothetical protein